MDIGTAVVFLFAIAMFIGICAIPVIVIVKTTAFVTKSAQKSIHAIRK